MKEIIISMGFILLNIKFQHFKGNSSEKYVKREVTLKKNKNNNNLEGDWMSSLSQPVRSLDFWR